MHLFESTVKITFMLHKHTRPVYRLHNATCIIAVILRGSSVHCHRATEHVIIITTLWFKASRPLQKAQTLLHIFPQDHVVHE